MRVYLCDSEEIGALFDGEVGPGTTTLAGEMLASEAEEEVVVELSLGAGAVSGTVAVGGGEPQPFEATEASGDAGVYAADAILDDDEHWGGWIVLHDGSQQGAALRCTRNPLTGDRLYIPVHRR